MKKILIRTLHLLLAVLFVWPVLGSAQELKQISLPKPDLEGGRPLMQVLKDRHSTREFSNEKLSMQMLSNLLWAAAGINRPESGKRTAPSAVNWQETDVYVASPDGLYLYEAKTNSLKQILAQDIRAMTGTQSYVAEAAVNLIYVADFLKMGKATDEQKVLYSAAGTGFISENVYLFCASAGLATVVRASIDKPELAKIMKLRPEQRIILAQSVGYPKKK